MTSVRAFVDRNYRHFNAASLRDAAIGYEKHLRGGGKMFLTLAGAMSTAELGVSLAEMIRRGKVHAISCTGANLEEDVFNLVAHRHYERIPHYRHLTPEDEKGLLARHLNRVTDTCIPEAEAIRRIESFLLQSWQRSEIEGRPLFPHEHLYRILLSGELEPFYQIDPADSWLLAAARANLPLFVPGWEDSTTGNIFAARRIDGSIGDRDVIRYGVDYMIELARWYLETSRDTPIGFFQIGGGIAGDFPICVVPMISQDLEREIRLWSYFCQISDAVTSYGGYSGAVPSEKITWGKLGADTPSYIIESDATIVAPLIFNYLLEGENRRDSTT
ncbi:MAG: deoxyhypusine synthase family protein [Akkermansiaceae bacterium]|nr:deoxyhypusine synthase family protein [Akkermansiaceae bacterium]